MYDIYWDIETGDIMTTGSGSTFDFVAGNSQSQISNQNGGILLLGKGMNSSQPQYGIGIGININGSTPNANFEYNRWVQQVQADGGAAAFKYYTAIQDVALSINYPN